MQDEKTLKQMTREYEQEMPSDIMDIITKFDWKAQLRGIVRENNLMLDVGTDLEEIVYMMILGAIKVEDVYERMVDVHELPEEKVQKVLHEIEDRIFNPLFARLAKTDKEDDKSDAVTGGVKLHSPVDAESSDVSRDSILAEIENDELDTVQPVASNIVMPGGRTLAPASMEKTSASPSSVNPSVGVSSSVPADTAVRPAVPEPASPVSDRLGLRDIPSSSPASSKPFSLSGEDAVEVRKIEIPSGNEPMVQPIMQSPERMTAAPVASVAPSAPIAQGIQADPIVAGLTGQTATAAPLAQQTPVASAPKSYASDPYREPIE
jgi:hypothetical protein